MYGYPSGEAAEVAGLEVRRFLEELEEKGGKEGGLERVVFCIFEAKDERAYGEWLPKIFPPRPEDLPTKEEPAEAGAATAKPSTEEASAASNETTDEPQAKKLKTSTEDLDKDDWEAVEKPTEATADEAADTLGEEGEKVEAAELGGSDGEKVEKPVAEQKGGTGTSVGHAQPESTLAKDW